MSHAPFGATGLRSSFSKDRVAVESTDGRVVEELLTPRASFAGHQLSTPWTDLQLAFFVGCAMWTYLNVPFVLAWPEVKIEEAGSWWTVSVLVHARVVEQLTRLRLRYVAERLDAVLADAARSEPTYLDFLDSVLRQEVDAKQRTRVTMALKIVDRISMGTRPQA